MDECDNFFSFTKERKTSKALPIFQLVGNEQWKSVRVAVVL